MSSTCFGWLTALESSTWRCPNCAASGLEPGSTVPPRTPRVRPKSPAKDKASGRLRKRKSDELEEEDGPIGTRRRKRRDKSKANGIIEDVADDEGEPDDSTLLNGATRKRRKLDRKPVVTIKLVPGKLMVHIGGLDPNKLAMVAKEKSRPIRGRGARNNTPAVKQKVNTTANQDLPTASTTLYPVIYDEDKSKPYGGILSEPDAVTKDTLPGSSERAQFETAKKKGEEEKKMRTQIMDRITKSNTQGRPGSDQETKRVGEASLIESIHFGEYEIDTWYAAPYPEEYSLNKILWICEFCLKYMNSEYVCWRHKVGCTPQSDFLHGSSRLYIR